MKKYYLLVRVEPSFVYHADTIYKWMEMFKCLLLRSDDSVCNKKYTRFPVSATSMITEDVSVPSSIIDRRKGPAIMAYNVWRTGKRKKGKGDGTILSALIMASLGYRAC